MRETEYPDKTDKAEFLKLFTEYLRHITTLSTGSIVLIATFLEKIFTKPYWKPAVVLSLIGFMVAVVSSVLAYTIGVFFENPMTHGKDRPEWAAALGTAGVFLTWIGFLIGILSLALFAIRNLVA